MKKGVLILVVMAAITFFGISLSDASSEATDPFNGDKLTTISKAELDGVHHAIIFFNNTQGTFIAAALNADGVPTPFIQGFSFFRFDPFTNQLLGSTDGISWESLEAN